MKKNFILLTSLVSLGLITLLWGCKCPSCQRQEDAVVPSNVLKKANEVIIYKTGKEFFDQYIKPDFGKIKYNAPYYDMVYDFYMPEKPWVNVPIKFSVDSLGALAKDRDAVGIPDCKDDNCQFNISEEQAVKIAKENGLEPGIKEWQKGFIWSPKLKQYVWRVISTAEESNSSQGTRARGKEFVIDPNSGLILEMNDWHVM